MQLNKTSTFSKYTSSIFCLFLAASLTYLYGLPALFITIAVSIDFFFIYKQPKMASNVIDIRFNKKDLWYILEDKKKLGPYPIQKIVTLYYERAITDQTVCLNSEKNCGDTVSNLLKGLKTSNAA